MFLIVFIHSDFDVLRNELTYFSNEMVLFLNRSLLIVVYIPGTLNILCGEFDNFKSSILALY